MVKIGVYKESTPGNVNGVSVRAAVATAGRGHLVGGRVWLWAKLLAGGRLSGPISLQGCGRAVYTPL